MILNYEKLNKIFKLIRKYKVLITVEAFELLKKNLNKIDIEEFEKFIKLSDVGVLDKKDIMYLINKKSNM